MKKKHLFIIIGQSVAILVLVVYAFVQQTIAKESERAALAAQQEAVAHREAAKAAREEAEKQRMMAMVAQAEAEKQRTLAEEIYQKYQGKRK